MSFSIARSIFCFVAPVCLCATVAFGNENASAPLLAASDSLFANNASLSISQDDLSPTERLIAMSSSSEGNAYPAAVRSHSQTDAATANGFDSKQSDSVVDASSSNTWVFGALGGALVMGLALTGGSVYHSRTRHAARW